MGELSWWRVVLVGTCPGRELSRMGIRPGGEWSRNGICSGGDWPRRELSWWGVLKRTILLALI